uniref:Uncharacterized protein n=1 Tax=Leersia perrieri TaxID=77586 RepID=A0A0D9XY75_9ORYZ
MAPGQKVRGPRNTRSSTGQQTRPSTTPSSSKNVHGINKGKNLERLIKKAGHPLNLNISVERRPVGENHEHLFNVLKRSAIGKANCSMLPYVHKKGTKPFVALQHELKECYCTQDGWASTDAMEKHEKMLEMQQQTEEDETCLAEQQICERVLGKAYGYIRGRGHGPKPNRRVSSSSTNSNQQLEQELASTKEVVAGQQTQIETQQVQIETQQKQIDWLKSVVSKFAGIQLPGMANFNAPWEDCTTTTSVDRAGR